MHDFFEDHQSSDPLLEVDEEIGISVVFKSVSIVNGGSLTPLDIGAKKCHRGFSVV